MFLGFMNGGSNRAEYLGCCNASKKEQNNKVPLMHEKSFLSRKRKTDIPREQKHTT
jgi:hypothetical protein